MAIDSSKGGGRSAFRRRWGTYCRTVCVGTGQNSSLPDGYDAVIDDRDYGLSGGQKQQLMLTRVLVHEAAIILLDEFTSALDHATEELAFTQQVEI